MSEADAAISAFPIEASRIKGIIEEITMQCQYSLFAHRGTAVSASPLAIVRKAAVHEKDRL